MKTNICNQIESWTLSETLRDYQAQAWADHLYARNKKRLAQFAIITMVITVFSVITSAFSALVVLSVLLTAYQMANTYRTSKMIPSFSDYEMTNKIAKFAIDPQKIQFVHVDSYMENSKVVVALKTGYRGKRIGSNQTILAHEYFGPQEEIKIFEKIAEFKELAKQVEDHIHTYMLDATIAKSNIPVCTKSDKQIAQSIEEAGLKARLQKAAKAA